MTKRWDYVDPVGIAHHVRSIPTQAGVAACCGIPMVPWADLSERAEDANTCPLCLENEPKINAAWERIVADHNDLVAAMEDIREARKAAGILDPDDGRVYGRVMTHDALRDRLLSEREVAPDAAARALRALDDHDEQVARIRQLSPGMVQ